MTKDTNAVQTLPQPRTGEASGDLELKSVGNAGLVVVYDRNAYGAPKAP